MIKHFPRILIVDDNYQNDDDDNGQDNDRDEGNGQKEKLRLGLE